MKRTQASVFAALAFMLLPLSYGRADQIEHNAYVGELLVEHAQIVLPAPGEPTAAGYLVIWNGKQKEANLAAVESESFATIQIQRTVFEGGDGNADPYGGILPIPSQAELIMRPGGVYLELKDPTEKLSAGETLNLTVVFYDGQRLTADAAILAPGAQLVDHHHAKADRLSSG